MTRPRCHNPACRRLFVPRRTNQRHCDTLCGKRCRPCNHPREQRRDAQLRALRRAEKRGLNGNRGGWRPRIQCLGCDEPGIHTHTYEVTSDGTLKPAS